MTKIRTASLMALVILFLPISAWAGFAFDLRFGAPYNFHTPFYYWQKGMKDVDQVWADYYSEPFTEAPYYSYRFAWIQDSGNRWELELIHQKIHLKNLPPIFKSFNISHGYNFLLVNRAWKEEHFTWRVGGGLIIAHPEVLMTNGESIPFKDGTLVGFAVAGVGAQISINRNVFLWEGLYLSPEIKFAVGQAQVDIPDGFANVPHAAIHFTLGVGWETGTAPRTPAEDGA